MKNFIKAHPYLSCAGLALSSNAALALLIKNNKVGFFTGFLGLALFTTLPSMGITAIDKYVHQNLIDNKPLQYGLIALESVLAFPSIARIIDNENRFLNYYSHLITLDFSVDSIVAKAITANSPIQSLGFKYIFDLADEQIEIADNQSFFVEDTMQNI